MIFNLFNDFFNKCKGVGENYISQSCRLHGQSFLTYLSFKQYFICKKKHMVPLVKHFLVIVLVLLYMKNQQLQIISIITKFIHISINVYTFTYSFKHADTFTFITDL